MSDTDGKVFCTKPNPEVRKKYHDALARSGHPIGGLYFVFGHDKKKYGQTMILLDVVNGQGKFWTQNRFIIWDALSTAHKVNYNLPHYHGGDPDYWSKQFDDV